MPIRNVPAARYAIYKDGTLFDNGMMLHVAKSHAEFLSLKFPSSEFSVKHAKRVFATYRNGVLFIPSFNERG